MDINLIQWIAQQAGATGIAFFAMWMLDRAHKERLRENRETIEQGRADRVELISVIRENAKTFTALQGAIDNLMREMQHQRRQGGGND